MRFRHTILFFIGILILVACQDKKREEAVSSVKEWMGKDFVGKNDKKRVIIAFLYNTSYICRIPSRTIKYSLL